MSSRFSYVTPGMERFSFYLPRAVIIIIIILIIIIIIVVVIIITFILIQEKGFTESLLN